MVNKKFIICERIKRITNQLTDFMWNDLTNSITVKKNVLYSTI